MGTLSLNEAIEDTDKGAMWHNLSHCKTGKIMYSTIYYPDEELKKIEDSSNMNDNSDNKHNDQTIDQKNEKDEDKIPEEHKEQVINEEKQVQDESNEKAKEQVNNDKIELSSETKMNKDNDSKLELTTESPTKLDKKLTEDQEVALFEQKEESAKVDVTNMSNKQINETFNNLEEGSKLTDEKEDEICKDKKMHPEKQEEEVSKSKENKEKEEITFKDEQVIDEVKRASITEMKKDQTMTATEKELSVPLDASKQNEVSLPIKDQSSNLIECKEVPTKIEAVSPKLTESKAPIIENGEQKSPAELKDKSEINTDFSEKNISNEQVEDVSIEPKTVFTENEKLEEILSEQSDKTENQEKKYKSEKDDTSENTESSKQGESESNKQKEEGISENSKLKVIQSLQDEKDEPKVQKDKSDMSDKSSEKTDSPVKEDVVPTEKKEASNSTNKTEDIAENKKLEDVKSKKSENDESHEQEESVASTQNGVSSPTEDNSSISNALPENSGVSTKDELISPKEIETKTTSNEISEPKSQTEMNKDLKEDLSKSKDLETPISDNIVVKPGLLKLTVFKASELVNKDIIGKSDPFVKVKFNDMEFKSKKVRNCLSPE